MEKRAWTSLRLLVHWSTGAVIALGIEHNRWTRGATSALVLYLSAQLIGAIMARRSKRAKNQ